MDVMLPALERISVPCFRFNTAQFPRLVRGSVEYGRVGGARARIEADGQVLDLDGVTAVWNRRPGTPAPDPRMKREFRSRPSGFGTQSVGHTCRDGIIVIQDAPGTRQLGGGTG